MAEYIEREAALSLVRPDTPEDEKYVVTIATAKKLVRSIVRRTPAADVAPVVHGRWIEQEDPCGDPYYTCSACKDDFYIEMTGAVEKDLFLYSYCPSCGAKMDEKGEEA